MGMLNVCIATLTEHEQCVLSYVELGGKVYTAGLPISSVGVQDYCLIIVPFRIALVGKTIHPQEARLLLLLFVCLFCVSWLYYCITNTYFMPVQFVHAGWACIISELHRKRFRNVTYTMHVAKAEGNPEEISESSAKFI